MRAVRAAEALDGGVSTPAGLKEVMIAARLVLGSEAGMIAPPGAASIGEDQDLLGAAHEGVGLGEIGARAAALDALATVRVHDDAPAAPRHLGDGLRAEMPDDVIEGGADDGEGAELLDQGVAHVERLLAEDWAAVLVRHRLGAGLAGIVDEGLHLPDREGGGQIRHKKLPRRKFDIQICALSRR